MDANREAEILRRLGILKEEMEKGKVVFAKEVADDMIKSLTSVQLDRNGSIDLSTIDGRVRSLALAVTAMKDREDLKTSIPLPEIQQTYFTFLERNFGGYYKLMIEKGITPHQLATAISRSKEAVLDIVSYIPEFMNYIHSFWEQAYDVSSYHIEDMGVLKGVFGGDLFPSNEVNIASTCGVYIDTIVLPDPFIRTAPLLDKLSDEKKVYYLIKHGLNVLQYKELALAEVNPPIIAIVADRIYFDNNEGELLTYFSDKDTITYLNQLFGKGYSSIEEYIEFVADISQPEDIVACLADPSKLLFDTEWNGTLIEQINRHFAESPGVKEHGLGMSIIFSAVGRMRQANDMVLKSRHLHGSPLLDAPTSWRYFEWKLEYDAAVLNPDNLVDFHIAQGLQSSALGQMSWLGNVPPEVLIDIRKQGALPELRSLLSKGVADIAHADAANFAKTGKQVVRNIQEAFKQHQGMVDELSKKKWRFGRVELAKCMAHGAIELAAAYLPPVSLIKSLTDQTCNVPKIKDIFKEMPEKYNALLEEAKRLDGSPVGLLFSHANKRKGKGRR